MMINISCDMIPFTSLQDANVFKLLKILHSMYMMRFRIRTKHFFTDWNTQQYNLKS